MNKKYLAIVTILLAFTFTVGMITVETAEGFGFGLGGCCQGYIQSNQGTSTSGNGASLSGNNIDVQSQQNTGNNAIG
jgi:hypothetical protein